MRRSAFNRALAEKNVNAIGAILAQNAVLVTGTDSALISGRKAQLQVWKREFGAAEATLYIRTPTIVLASSVEPIALEHGDWQGIVSTTGKLVASGSYTAKWREIDADWVIEAEIYLTLA